MAEDSISRTAKPTPTNGVIGVIDDVCDALGAPRPQEFLPPPADLLHAIGFPTFKEAVPTPRSIADSMVSGRELARLPRPPMPPTPQELMSGMVRQ